MKRRNRSTYRAERAVLSALGTDRHIQLGPARSALHFLRSCFPYWLLFFVFLFASCKREERGFRVPPPSAEKIGAVSLSDLHPAGASQPMPMRFDYDENAYAISQGQNLYSSFNCVGCHAHGGGGMGPPLMDNKWVYGSKPQQIFATIIEGRPNGMPSFRGKIPDYQVWQLAAYVRSLSGLVSSNAAPARSDEMKGSTPPNSMPQETPYNSSLPPSAQHP
jgi:cytochrome c oxidase cbb3-type subunit 3